MAQHLKTKFADKLTQEARVASVVANRFTDEFNFVGAKTVQVSTNAAGTAECYSKSAECYGNAAKRDGNAAKRCANAAGCYSAG